MLHPSPHFFSLAAPLGSRCSLSPNRVLHSPIVNGVGPGSDYRISHSSEAKMKRGEFHYERAFPPYPGSQGFIYLRGSQRYCARAYARQLLLCTAEVNTAHINSGKCDSVTGGIGQGRRDTIWQSHYHMTFHGPRFYIAVVDSLQYGHSGAASFLNSLLAYSLLAFHHLKALELLGKRQRP
jgi:hypothetical protein